MVRFVKKYLTSKMKADMRWMLATRQVKISPEPVCDFCGDGSPIYVYAATRMSTGLKANCWRWCACVPCAEVVDANDWKKLSERVQAKLSLIIPFVPKDIMEEAVRVVVQDFINEAMQE